MADGCGVAEEVARGGVNIDQQKLPKPPVCVCPAWASVLGGGGGVSPVEAVGCRSMTGSPCELGVKTGVSPVCCPVGVDVRLAGTARRPDGAVPVETGAGAAPQPARASNRAKIHTRLHCAPLIVRSSSVDTATVNRHRACR